MSLIFISYRRDDSAPYAGRLYDRLTARFGKGQVFMDIDQIDPGEDFVEVIERKVGACGIAVVLIGKAWLNASDAQGKRRLDDPEDFVRLEVAAALRRNVRVLPVLVGGATMPKMQQLPEPLATLSRRNAFEISDTRFHSDVDKLIEALERASTPGQAGPPRSEPRADDEAAAAAPRTDRAAKPRAVVAVAALGIGVVGAAALWAGYFGPSGRHSVEAAAPSGSVQPALRSADGVGAIGSPMVSDPKAAGGFGSVAGLIETSQRAVAGSAEAQYDLATAYECGQNKNLPEALRWYELAAAQGHSPSREALSRLRAPLPTEAKEKEFETVRRDIDCLGRLQKRATKVLDQMDDKARTAIRNIKPG